MEASIHPDVVDGDRDYGVLGLAFCGPELRASSVVVPPDTTTESDIERIIVQVRQLFLMKIVSLIEQNILLSPC